MKSQYSVAELAELAGVTVKALHHYDRLGLLRPRRSNAGYRLYSSRDLERLEQIVALKAIGLSLEQIKVVLDGDVHALANALRAQRQELENKRGELTRTIRAIERVESTLSLYRALSRGGVLTRLIEAIEMQTDLDAMKPYFKTDASWARGRTYFEQWPSDAWRELFREIQASLGEDPASEHARSLASRWDTLFRADTNADFALRAGLWRAWRDFDGWPDSLKQGVVEFDFVGLWKFIAEVSWARVGPDGRLPDADPRRAPDRVSASKIALFREIAASLDADPTGPQTRELIGKWRALADVELAGDAEAKATLSKSLANRSEWPAGYQRYLASLYDTTVDTWAKVIDAVLANHLPT
jgi:DNA-binding transcriptional MerR regulator